MKQITFSAGYGDPNRTIEQKYSDYEKIDHLVNKYNNRNAQLEHAINDLAIQRDSLISTFNNVPGADAEEIQAKIQKLNSEIEAMNQNIEVNKHIITGLWYGYHERV